MMTDNAKAFLAENKRSPVVTGVAIGNGGQGAIYVLKNKREFTLSREECQAVGMPRWDIPEATHDQ